jgi:16S rRNA (adenine1518-N6/adenine1519-N6)-dimethyltransferase
MDCWRESQGNVRIHNTLNLFKKIKKHSNLMMEILSAWAYNLNMSKSARLGQNFLRDENYAQRIVDLLETSAGPLLEIGAGKGILSERLLGKFPGRHIILVEIDPVLARELEHRLGGRVEVLATDILDVDLMKMFPQIQVAVIGNLPYHISKPLIDWFIAQRLKISAAVLMLQKDFVDKLLAPCGGKKYNAQSVVFQTLFHTRRCFDVPAGAFAPKPKIVSTVLSISPYATPQSAGSEEFYPFVKQCFAERRKTLWNNLAPSFGKQALADAAAASGIKDTARAEELPPHRFYTLFSALFASLSQGSRCN